jgi:leucine dehydrogenase
MEVLKEMKSYGHEMIVFGQDESVGLKCIIAVHSTALGPALGGTRFWDYQSEDEALYDVLRLSRGMSLKNAAAGLHLGGGKAVIIGDAKKLKSEAFFRAYGKIVDRLGGAYYTAEDVQTTDQDMVWISKATKYVTGLPGKSGNPSPFTSLGVYMAMKASAKEKYGNDSLAGKVIAIQGLGNVGYGVAKLAAKEGAKLKVFDINKDKIAQAISELKAVAIDGDKILSTDCDILAPCALGAILNTDNVKDIKASVICGCANNQLVDNATGDLIDKLGILYNPDYIANGGGVINCAVEIEEPSYDEKIVTERVKHIYEASLMVFKKAKDEKIPTYAAADEYAMGIIKAAQKAK